MEKLWARQAVCDELGISMRTLCRKLSELNIECISEPLPNGTERKQIRNTDYLRLKAAFLKTVGSHPESRDLITHELQFKLLETKLSLDYAKQSLQEKDEQIRRLQDEKDGAEKKNDRLFEAWMELSQKYEALLKEKAERGQKGFIARVFGN